MRVTLGKLVWVLGIIAVLLAGVVLFYPVNPLEIKNVQIKGDNFKAGGELTFVIDRCKTVDASVPGTASRYFVYLDEKKNVDPTKQPVFISSTDDLGGKGCATVTRTTDIPAHIKSACYKLKFVTRYFPSVLREPIKVEYMTKQSFCVQGQTVSAKLDSILQTLEEIDGEITPPQSQSIQEDINTSVSNVVPQASTPEAARLNQLEQEAQQSPAQTPQPTQRPTPTPVAPAPTPLDAIRDAINGLVSLLPVV